jgi:PKD repeat protein
MKIISWKMTVPIFIVIMMVGLSSLVAGCAKAPVASFTADKYVTTIGTSVQFSGKSASEVTSWLWDFGDGAISSEQNPTHVYTKKGDFSAILTVSNKAGNSTAKANIRVLPTIVADFTAKNVALVAENIRFSDTSSGDSTSYSWDFGDGQTAKEQNPSHRYTGTGSFTVSLQVSNQVSNDTKTMQVKIVAPVKADFSTLKSSVQTGSAIQFSDNSSGDITSYSWDFGDGQTAKEQNPSHRYTGTGSFTVSLHVSNQVSNDTKTMQVKIVAPVKADFSVSTITYQTGTAIQFADKSSGDIISYSWDFGDGSISAEKNPKHAYNTRGSYAVTLTVSNDVSCDIAASKVQIAVSSLSINLLMCSNVVSNENYTVKPDATFKKYEPVYFYLEVKGFQQNHTSDGYNLWVQLHSLKVIKPDGSLLLNLSDALENHTTIGKASLYVYFWYFFGSATTTDLTGEYKVECMVVDKLCGDSKTVSTSFIIK